MSRKPKFKPEITRVKLNPEQAVLVCDCYSDGKLVGSADKSSSVAAEAFIFCTGPKAQTIPFPLCEGSGPGEAGSPFDGAPGTPRIGYTFSSSASSS